MMVTAQPVLADTRNKAPVFPDQDMEMEGRQTDQKRMIGENVPAVGEAGATELVRTIGNPVVAMDFIIAPDTGAETPEILTYTLGGPDAASFSIDRGTAQISTKVALDYETKDTYTVTVTATDPSELTATITVTIKVTDEDEAPMITVGGLAVSGMARVDYAENGMGDVATYTASGPDADMATWSLGGDDAGEFNFIDGVLTFRSSPNYEAAADADTDNVYMVTVEADDGTYMDSHDVTVTVTNVDEKGTVTLSTTRPIVDTAIIATLDDPDGEETGVTWQWANSDAMDGTYTDILDATTDTYTPVEADNTMFLRAMASYTDGEGSGKSASEATASAVTGNTAPDFADATAERSVAENTAAGGNIGAPVAATDADAGDTLTYTLGGADAASFDIDANTGQLQVKDALDYETRTSYEVEVTARDGSGVSDMITVTITVTDLSAGSALGDTYDTSDDERIDKEEARAAVDAYFAGTITKEDARAIITLYFAHAS